MFPPLHRCGNCWVLMGEDEEGWAVYRCCRFWCRRWKREKGFTSELITDRVKINELEASMLRRSAQGIPEGMIAQWMSLMQSYPSDGWDGAAYVIASHERQVIAL